ncbi:cysteine hydrolase [Rathayibacter tritici]|uniref:Hydrolase n=1 Tax=Rathayibacter tritici TaxID=33888 RepID=A0A160KUB0_9MICO|nr:cysteine hydrolase [Rathayibacter tritici]AND17157.1 hydrolase [Rathayibacter tritici]PPF30661.1 cysteine hydrolase [Rathayibacter tritici]PPF70818.1 cysteine hydrolase [Rathayibacter tritici]PPG08826.1 cysteine hydrolase [Rathayibacter tritici]PPI14870.1 cysteine hydrolase [Rathayibacter tritici]
MSLLVAIDLQHVFADADSPWGSAEFARAVEGTRRLLPAFGERVVTTRFVAPEQPSGAWIPYYREWPFALVPQDDRLYDLVDGVEGHRTITATTFGKWGPELEAELDDSRELVLTGVATDCCVLSTALAAADAGVRVRVVADACAGASEADHRRALDAMALYAPLIEVTILDVVLAEGRNRG